MKTSKLILSLSVLLSTALFCSCSSGPTSKELELSNVKIMGDDNQYIEVVPGTYTLNFDEDDDRYNASITLTLRLIKEVGELQNKEAKYGNIQVSLLDNEDQKVDIDNLSPKDGGWDKIADLLKSEVGSEIKVKFSPYAWGSDADKITEFERITNIELTDADFSEISSYSSSSSDSDDDSDSDDSSVSTPSSSSSDDWDAVIDDYEEFIDKYIALLKDAKAGNTGAMTEYASMLSKAQSLQTKLTNAQSNLTASQAARFSKIVTKMASAASSMQ